MGRIWGQMDKIYRCKGPEVKLARGQQEEVSVTNPHRRTGDLLKTPPEGSGRLKP